MIKRTNQGGFIGIAIGILIALAILGGGYVAVKSVAKHKADVDANSTSSVRVEGSESGESSIQVGGVSATSNGVEAGVTVGGVKINTNGSAASVTFKGTNSSGSVTSGPGSASVTTKTSASVSGSASGASTVTLSSINPSSAAIGQTVIIHGSGFSKSGNTIKAVYGLSGTIGGISSTDGATISLTIPQQVQTGPVSVQIQPGTYVVSVINASGVESNKVTFTITR